jgi:hypothetical protein
MCLQKIFRKYSNKHSEAESFILTSMYTRHVSGRWYTPDSNVTTTNIQTFVQPWHQDQQRGVQEIGLNCL